VLPKATALVAVPSPLEGEGCSDRSTEKKG